MHKTITLDAKTVRQFAQKSDLKGAYLVLFNWSLIAVAFVLPVLWFHPLTLIVSLILLANRQLGLAILMHECSHYSLFNSHKANQVIGTVFCAAPVLANLNAYRRYHLSHHKHAGTTDDPDYGNYKHYPISKASWLRKAIRDFTGITGVKLLYAMLLMSAGLLSYDMSYQFNKMQNRLPLQRIAYNLVVNLWLPVVVHLALYSALALLDMAWCYALWWISYFSVYMFVIRVRNAAEHGGVPDLLDTNPLLHARTTYASWWERLTFAPNYVNYHLEHHLRPNIPCYNLKAFHTFLLRNDYLDTVPIASGYPAVLKQLSKPLS